MRNENFMQDDVLDRLAALAFWMEEAGEVEGLLCTDAPPLSVQEIQLAEEIFQRTMAAGAQMEERRERLCRRATFRRVFSRVIQAAACFVVVMGIAVPAAIAWVPAFRARVMQLLVQVDQRAGEAYVSFEEDVQSAFDVPAEWRGRYFPSYLPDGMAISYISRYGVHFIEYTSADGRRITFAENSEDTSMTAGTEGADTYFMTINGHSAFVTEYRIPEEYFISFIWATDAKWFELSAFNIPKEEAIKIAESVREVIK